MNMQCACWLWRAIDLVLQVCRCPTFSLSTPFHLVSVLITVWSFLSPDSTLSFPWLIPSLGFFQCVPQWFWYSVLTLLLLCKTTQAFPRSFSDKPLYALKCCLIFGFNKLAWSMLVATTFFWKSDRIPFSACLWNSRCVKQILLPALLPLKKPTVV